jgi:hypothetical protein
MSKISSKKLIFLLAVMLTATAFGQFIPPPPPPPPGLPVDGGIIVLALIGALYGVKKLRK